MHLKTGPYVHFSELQKLDCAMLRSVLNKFMDKKVGQCWMGCFNEPNTIPSPKPKFCPKREVSVNVGLREG